MYHVDRNYQREMARIKIFFVKFQFQEYSLSRLRLNKYSIKPENTQNGLLMCVFLV